MSTQTFHPRLSGDNLAEVKKYAADQGICETAAISRLLAEGRAAREGRPIPSRWALADPKAMALYSQHLQGLIDLARALRECKSALARPRPAAGEDVGAWVGKQKAADVAFSRVDDAVRQAQSAGKMVPPDVSYEAIERIFNKLDPNVGGDVLNGWKLFGAFLGKNTAILPPPKAKPAAVTQATPTQKPLAAQSLSQNNQSKTAPIVTQSAPNFDSLIPDSPDPKKN